MFGNVVLQVVASVKKTRRGRVLLILLFAKKLTSISTANLLVIASFYLMISTKFYKLSLKYLLAQRIKAATLSNTNSLTPLAISHYTR